MVIRNREVVSLIDFLGGGFHCIELIVKSSKVPILSSNCMQHPCTRGVFIIISVYVVIGVVWAWESGEREGDIDSRERCPGLQTVAGQSGHYQRHRSPVPPGRWLWVWSGCGDKTTTVFPWIDCVRSINFGSSHSVNILRTYVLLYSLHNTFHISHLWVKQLRKVNLPVVDGDEEGVPVAAVSGGSSGTSARSGRGRGRSRGRRDPHEGLSARERAVLCGEWKRSETLEKNAHAQGCTQQTMFG